MFSIGLDRQVSSKEHHKEKIRERKTKELIELIDGVNALGGTVNCGRVALRVNDLLSHGKPDERVKPVSRKDALLYSYPELHPLKEDEIRRAYVDDERIIQRSLLDRVICLDEKEEVDLTEDVSKTIIHLDCELQKDPEDEEQQQKVKIRLYKADCAIDLIDAIRTLPRRKKDGSAHGFLFYTHKNCDLKLGHIANFYVDEQDEVYFIDAQPKPKTAADKALWVQRFPHNDAHFRKEIFFIHTNPPEGFRIKREPESLDIKIKKEFPEDGFSQLPIEPPNSSSDMRDNIYAKEAVENYVKTIAVETQVAELQKKIGMQDINIKNIQKMAEEMKKRGKKNNLDQQLLFRHITQLYRLVTPLQKEVDSLVESAVRKRKNNVLDESESSLDKPEEGPIKKQKNLS